MNIILNGKKVEIEKPVSIKELIKIKNISADVFIINSFPVSIDHIVFENDNVTLIKKGVMPTYEELEYMIISRQGLDLYNKLKKAKVVIAGIGGLGSHAAASLVRIGVGNIKIIDFDVVEPSNINRQFYFIDQIGMQKTEALTINLKRINPYVNITFSNTYLAEENIINELKNHNVILECFDNPLSKMLLVEKCIKELPESYIIGASGVAGYYNTEDIKIKKLGKNCIIVGDFEHEATFNESLMAPRVSVCANIQANEAVKYLLKDI